jgi:peroxiredoxin
MQRFMKALIRFASSWWSVLVIAVLVGTLLYQRWHFLHPSLAPVLAAGERLPDMTWETVEGKPMRFAWAAGHQTTILYIFRVNCPWCLRNHGAVTTLADGAPLADYRFVALSLGREGLNEYLARNPSRFPVYVAQDPKAIKPLKIVMTPETILVSDSGIVQKVWLGAYSGKNRKGIEEAFKVTLPVVARE